MSANERTNRARRDAAQALDAALRTTRITNGALGALCGVDEKRVRRWRSDDAADLDAAPPITALVACDWALFEELVERVRAARVELHGPSTTKSKLQLALAVLGSDARVNSIVCEAASDGAIQPHEEPAILDALAESGARRTELVAAFAKRGAK